MNSTDLLIRPLERKDHEKWSEYWIQYQNFYQVNLSPETTEKTWERFFDPSEPVHCAIAADREDIYGFANFVFHRSTWGRNDFCYLEDLYVSSRARGQMVGKRLIEYVQARAREKQCDRFYWHTQESNQTAQRLYDWIAEKPGVVEYRMPLSAVQQ